eukprot:11194026-Lingulodinium_polyedra.AAC.1
MSPFCPIAYPLSATPHRSRVPRCRREAASTGACGCALVARGQRPRGPARVQSESGQAESSEGPARAQR